MLHGWHDFVKDQKSKGSKWSLDRFDLVLQASGERPICEFCLPSPHDSMHESSGERAPHGLAKGALELLRSFAACSITDVSDIALGPICRAFN